ncbi:BLUF domain-containing protein [Xanthomonas citri]|uniref:BLUF domain-containing protein n=1 Tax=Xanthomonas citri TaxID=346 RepID=UPI001C042526|nr:BLUF domain-containing protein [Xanthomonas citri]QWN07038.1 blue light sensor protein [Xanthomonas citri pv. fuscans]
MSGKGIVGFTDLQAWIGGRSHREAFLPNPPLQAVAYVSEARRPMSMGELDRLLISSSAHNSQAGITGVLLYDGARFFQYFEGPPAGVRQTYDRVRQSSRHIVIAEVYNGSITERHFPDWQMACKKVEIGSIVQISAQRWSRAFMALSIVGKKPEAVSHLIKFWESGEIPSL